MGAIDSAAHAKNYRDLAWRMRTLAQHEQDRGKQRELVETANQYERLAARIVGDQARRDALYRDG